MVLIDLDLWTRSEVIVISGRWRRRLALDALWRGTRRGARHQTVTVVSHDDDRRRAKLAIELYYVIMSLGSPSNLMKAHTTNSTPYTFGLLTNCSRTPEARSLLRTESVCTRKFPHSVYCLTLPIDQARYSTYYYIFVQHSQM